MLLHFSILLLVVLFRPHLHDLIMTMVLGTLITVIVVIYFRHRDTVLYTDYLRAKEDRLSGKMDPMDALFSFMNLSPMDPHAPASTATMEDITEEETIAATHPTTATATDAHDNEKPKDASE